MRAAVFKGVEDIQVEDVPAPAVEADAVVVKVSTCVGSADPTCTRTCTGRLSSPAR